MREYGVDLAIEFREGMSWRRFNSLLNNLSPESLLVRLHQKGNKSNPQNNTDYNDPNEAEKAAFSMWGL